MTIAVAVALYNGERFLIPQLDSLRMQTRPVDRIVFCDDGSKDGTVRLVEDYIAEHHLSDRWCIVRNEKNLGYARNFYKAISLCDAEVVYLCDQDDVWATDKIEKMTAIMESRDDINLLSCRYGIIDGDGAEQTSLVEDSAREDGKVLPVKLFDILCAYRWPGMVMGIRKSFFEDIHSMIKDCTVAHDLMFCLLAADREGFFEYGYLGAYHRRHGNNAAREEHRVTKLLNLQRKLQDIAVTRKLWEGFFASGVSLREENESLIKRRYESLLLREEALREKSLTKVWRLYRKDSDGFLRKKSMVCDLWLSVFGKKES